MRAVDTETNRQSWQRGGAFCVPSSTVPANCCFLCAPAFPLRIAIEVSARTDGQVKEALSWRNFPPAGPREPSSLSVPAALPLLARHQCLIASARHSRREAIGRSLGVPRLFFFFSALPRYQVRGGRAKIMTMITTGKTTHQLQTTNAFLSVPGSITSGQAWGPPWCLLDMVRAAHSRVRWAKSIIAHHWYPLAKSQHLSKRAVSL